MPRLHLRSAWLWEDRGIFEDNRLAGEAALGDFQSLGKPLYFHLARKGKTNFPSNFQPSVEVELVVCDQCSLLCQRRRDLGSWGREKGLAAFAT